MEDRYRMDVGKMKGHREQCQQNERESFEEVDFQFFISLDAGTQGKGGSKRWGP